jgi:hypothetical protein
MINRCDDSQGSILTQRELRRTPLFVASVTKGKGKGWAPTSGPRPAFFPLFTNVLEGRFSEIRHLAYGRYATWQMRLHERTLEYPYYWVH